MRRTTWATALFLAPLALSAQQTSPVAQPPASAVPMDITSPHIDTLDRVVAVVGDSAIALSDLLQAVNQKRAEGYALPPDVKGQLDFGREVLGDLVDQDILVQKAQELKLVVSDQDVASAVDGQIKSVRSHFPNETDYRAELKQAGFGTPEEYKRSLTDQIRRHMLQQKAYGELVKGAKPANVTEEEVNQAYEQARPDLQKRPATVAFRQIVITPKPSKEEDANAKAKADSLLVQLQHGADFEELAKRESMDDSSAKLGGDLGWSRHGRFVPEFEYWMFHTLPGQLSPVFRTTFGYHILRVDRKQPDAVKVRHILIALRPDSNDVHQAFVLADSVATLWRKGTTFDSLVAKYHDVAEEKGLLEPDSINGLPDWYRAAIGNLQVNQVSEPFPLPLPQGSVKYAIVQIISRTGPGEYSLPEIRALIRAQLQKEKQTRAILDNLRKQTYVSIRL